MYTDHGWLKNCVFEEGNLSLSCPNSWVQFSTRLTISQKEIQINWAKTKRIRLTSFCGITVNWNLMSCEPRYMLTIPGKKPATDWQIMKITTATPSLPKAACLIIMGAARWSNRLKRLSFRDSAKIQSFPFDYRFRFFWCSVQMLKTNFLLRKYLYPSKLCSCWSIFGCIPFAIHHHARQTGLQRARYNHSSAVSGDCSVSFQTDHDRCNSKQKSRNQKFNGSCQHKSPVRSRTAWSFADPVHQTRNRKRQNKYSADDPAPLFRRLHILLLLLRYPVSGSLYDQYTLSKFQTFFQRWFNPYQFLAFTVTGNL